MDFGLRFAPAGNVTAETLGVPAPVCGDKSMAQIGPEGNWQCVQTPEAAGEGRIGFLLVAAAAVYVLVQVYSKRYRGIYDKVKHGDMGAAL